MTDPQSVQEIIDFFSDKDPLSPAVHLHHVLDKAPLWFLTKLDTELPLLARLWMCQTGVEKEGEQRAGFYKPLQQIVEESGFQLTHKFTREAIVEGEGEVKQYPECDVFKQLKCKAARKLFEYLDTLIPLTPKK